MRIAIVTLAVALAVPTALADAVEVGRPAPNFKVSNAEGKTLELRDLRGKRVLVFFWATW